MFVNFSDIPGHQNLFLDYLNEFENVSGFYKNDFRDQDSFAQIFSSLEDRSPEFSSSISEIIREQYSGYQPSKKTEVNIRSLASPKTVAVVTGQQLGILTGPLYTLYKTITAIKLSEHLKEKYDGYNFVPVFWMEGDDHDFEEISWIKFIDRSSELAKLSLLDEEAEEINKGSVGHLKLDENIEKLLNSLKENIRDTEFSEQIMGILKSSYTKDNTFSQAFRKILFALFDEYGLIVFDPQDIKIKEKLVPVFAKEIENFRKHTDAVLLRSAELEDTYHAQVKVRPVNLFFHGDDGRFAIEPDEDIFKLKGKRRSFNKEELLELIQSSPEKFSPNVLLRPICQDYLLPTAFYVAGPSEISYFAQVMPLYDYFNLTPPVLYPRISATIVDKNVRNLLDKFGLSVTDAFSDSKQLTEDLIQKTSEHDLENHFNETRSEISASIEKLKSKLLGIDKTLLPVIEKTEARIGQSLDNLKGKSDKAEERKYETDIRQLKRLQNHLYPDGNLQERELNFINYANRYGIDIFKWIFSELALNKFEHQIIELE